MVSPFDLSLRHLRAVGAIVRTGGLNAAAAAVGLSQPALTQGIAKLERQLGVALFQRRPDGMAPTPAGLAVAARADAAFAHLAAGGRTGGRSVGRPEHSMTATQLRAFLALADAGSFVTAALATGLSQPALHRSVRDLEQVIGVMLVERRGRGVALTAAGRRLARGTRLAGVEIAAGITETHGDGDPGGRIVVGAMPLSRASLVPRAVARLAAERPALSFSIVEGSWRELVEPLRDGAIDLMIGAVRPAPMPDLTQAPLYRDRLVVVAGARHPLAGAAAVTIGQLAAFPWIVGHGGSPLRAQWEALFDGHPPARPIECGSVMVLRGLLAEGDFLTLLSPAQVALEVANGVLAQVGGPLGESVRTIGITTRADWRPTGAQQDFIGHLSAVAGDIARRLIE